MLIVVCNNNNSHTFIMSTVINLILPFFGLIFMGFLAGKFTSNRESGLDWFNTFVIYFALPALTFQSIAAAPVEQLSNWSFIMATSFSTYVVFILFFAISILVLRTKISQAAVQSAAASYGNVGYIGLPLCVAALGSTAAVPAALIFCLDSALHFTLVPLLIAFGRPSKIQFGPIVQDIFRRVVLHPVIIATVLGAVVAFNAFQLPAPLNTLLDFLSGAAAPCALFAMGVTVAYQPLRSLGKELPLIAIVKTIVHPLIVLAVLGALGGFDPLWVGVAVLMGALPTASNVFVLALQNNEYVEGASSAVLVTTVISIFTVSLVLILIDRGKLPLSLF